MRLAVSGAQPLFTLGLLMFALPLVDFLSLLLSPSTDIKIFLFLSKVSFEGHIQNLQKISCWFKMLIGFVGSILSKLWTSSIWGFFFSCLCDCLLGVTYANMLVTTQWPLECVSHLTSLFWVCVLWRPESLTELSAICGNPLVCNQSLCWIRMWPWAKTSQLTTSHVKRKRLDSKSLWRKSTPLL